VTDLSRYADWISWLTARADADADVRCVWVGGSAATGGYDEWSDLDLDVLCTPGTSTAVYTRWLAQAKADFDVRDVWEVPLATWPDGRQAFINLQDRPGQLLEPTRLIDLHVSDLADHHTHLDVRRHGTPIVLHDPDSLLVLEDEDVSAALNEAVDQVRQRRVTGEWLVNRAIARGHVAEAAQWYLRFGLEPVVRLLRVEHCPWRHDYGLRYLREDLPPDVADQVEKLVPGNTSASLEELSLRCFAWLDELLADPPAETRRAGLPVP
jgi:predicted nucleotidyltransferase